jgi:hypothetical protein
MRFSRLHRSFAGIALLSTVIACSSSDKKTDATGGDNSGGSSAGDNSGGSSVGDNSGGTAGEQSTDKGGSGGESGSPTGGKSSTPDTTTAGSGGEAGSGNTPATGSLKDLIGALCDWEFKCCDAGEAKYQLGPTLASASACKNAFTYLLENDNTVSSPYPATLPTLLTMLGYFVDPTKVTENPTGIAQCIAQWKSRSCNVAPSITTPNHCTKSTYGDIDACSLVNLVKPKQEPGQPCNYTLNATSPTNDIECVKGSSCVNVGDPDNPSSTSATCVTRGTAGAVCTSDSKCDYGFYCDTTGTGTCTAKGEPGATCAYKDPVNPSISALTKPCMPGLTCNPVTKTCIEPCKTGFVCGGNDWICPSGESCIPITVGNVVDQFITCSAQHSVAAPITRCNSKEDCGAGYYCNVNSCKAVLAAGADCAGVAGECTAGTYCNGSVCTAYTLNTKPCTASPGSLVSAECDPASAIGCVVKVSDVGVETPICSATLLANGDNCTRGIDCASGKCEYATAAALYKTCIVGAALGGDCVATASAIAGNSTTCAAGLVCKSGQCVAQVGPGSSCESKTTAGTADSSLCANGSCDSSQWSAAGAIMCTDAAVSVNNGGTGVMCDGK